MKGKRGSQRDRRAGAAGYMVLFLLGAVIACACMGTPPHPPQGNVTTATPTVSPEPSWSPRPPGHPRLYFTAAEGALLQEKVATEPYRTWFMGVQQLARETPFPDGSSLTQQDLGNGARALRANAFVYALSG
ncbi:MAG: hypothetical protein LUO91_08450, partial [Methanomicrobiales archaeon]|nr:hypothetical protein [Methanomicrobiales archaeon]